MNVIYSYNADNGYMDGKVHEVLLFIRLLFHVWHVYLHKQFPAASRTENLGHP
jgi:hypothetical protein